MKYLIKETDWLVKNLIGIHECHLGAEKMKIVVFSVDLR